MLKCFYKSLEQETFIENLTIVTFVYVLCRIMSQNSKKLSESESWNIRFDNVGPNGINCPFLEGTFWVNWPTLVRSKYWIPSYCNISKSSESISWDIIACNNSLPNFGPNFQMALKEDFWGTENVTFVYLLCSFMLKCFQKILCDRSWDKRLNSFAPNWTQIVFLPAKGIFWENWLILMSTYSVPLCYNASKKNSYSRVD